MNETNALTREEAQASYRAFLRRVLERGWDSLGDDRVHLDAAATALGRANQQTMDADVEVMRKAREARIAAVAAERKLKAFPFSQEGLDDEWTDSCRVAMDIVMGVVVPTLMEVQKRIDRRRELVKAIATAQANQWKVAKGLEWLVQ